MNIHCSKCTRETLPEDLMPIQSEMYTYYYCKPCLREAHTFLSLKIIKNKDEKKLIRNMRTFLEHEKNN